MFSRKRSYADALAGGVAIQEAPDTEIRVEDLSVHFPDKNGGSRWWH